ncbi:uncharacterized protein EV422DRAFT_538413 [Fimicolochytrium jonesii]|uniref:uncharacterized protein n=1 Tax=Fimicolochytrium jonesii TaxID=1396493 RepID=UPI0022FECF02|nr:uncharacterized protein EV422DRAFT_538413 [Fimicolochytrium jonesii]KAI8818388.1 hypothetical protein EV422DRAFT_538413 [Fimicolochytrium jonesii]
MSAAVAKPSTKLLQNLVASKTVAESSLHVKTPKEWHIYGFPILPLYAVWFYVYFIAYERFFSGPEVGRLLFILVGAIHSLAFLVCQWSVKAAARLTCKKVTSVHNAEIIKIIPTAHNGAGALCDIKRVEDPKTHKKLLYFFFQQRKFVYNDETGLFEKLAYPTDEPRTIEHFSKLRGLPSEVDIAAANERYGANKFDIPIPTFQELFKEHMMAPFFVFQLFCVALWFLDDMWYYSLFTLAMLFVFESTVVLQRLRNLQEFRSMSIKPYPIHVYRAGRWHLIQTDRLLPGDIVSIVRQKDESPVAADMILLNGSCIANEAMLSGESTPQLKEPITSRESDDIFNHVEDKNNLLYGGTKVLQVTGAKEEGGIPIPPDNGALAYVVRTGFATQQGKLVQTIIYSTERITANNLESLLFIVFLLVFAIAASAYVWIEGTKNEERNRNKVLLDCILIITAVVPPELPMELSLAVNNSLIGLAKSYIYCTEPFRIPFAGKIDVACFDKTGTLTAENLIVEGVTGLDPNNVDQLLKPNALPERTTQTLAAAHALVMLDDGIIGDPMEKNTLESVQWDLTKGDILHPKAEARIGGIGGKNSLRILRRFHFSSALKRMSTLSARNEDGKEKIFVAVKGAPETIKDMLVSVPKGYDEHYKTWARRGKRVLALGYKVVDPKGSVESVARDLHRDQAESALHFVGFLVFGCPLKDDAVKAVRMLNKSSHRTVMITGDNALTACHVAHQVEIVKNEVLIADVWENGKLAWRSIDEKTELEPRLEQTAFDSRLEEYDLCCTGKALEQLLGSPAFASLLPRLWVYARVSPGQKETILTELKQAGYTTLMCGDGTNDVGALKQAHVGIALLDGKAEDIEKMNNKMKAMRQKAILEQQAKLREKWGLPPVDGQPGQSKQQVTNGPSAPGSSGSPGSVTAAGANATKPKKPPGLQDTLSAAMEAMDDQEGDVPKIKFGDASVAAPFTSKISSVMSVVNIVRQGRATLVAMVQMYKILALNCLISAFSMSVLYLAGIKQGDWQATIGGMMITACFFGIAKSTALEELSRQRPQSNVFNHYVIISVLGQVSCHVASLMYIQQQAAYYSDDLDEEIKLDAEFQPNLLNSGVYLVSLIMQISTFAINYQGLPFRESIRNNKALYNSLMIVGGIAIAAATEVSDELNEWMQLVPFPDKFRTKLVITMALDFFGAWVVEQICNYFFSDSKPKMSLFPRGNQ